MPNLNLPLAALTAEDLQYAMVMRAAEMAHHLIESEAENLAKAMGQAAVADAGGSGKFVYCFSVAIKIQPKGSAADIDVDLPWAVKYKASTSDKWQAADPAQPELPLDGRPASPTTAPPAFDGGLRLLPGVPRQLARAQFEVVSAGSDEVQAVYRCTHCLAADIMADHREAHQCPAAPSGDTAGVVLEAEFTTAPPPAVPPTTPVDEAQRALTCDVCGGEFTTKTAVKRHKRTIHGAV